MTSLVRLAIGAALILPLSLFSANVGAQQSRAITITPFLQEVVLNPDEPKKSFTVEVTNNTTTAANFSLLTVDFGTLNETGGVLFAGSASDELIKKYGLANWLSLDKKDISLQPGQRTQIQATIDNRTDLAPGGHYGAILITQEGVSSLSDQPQINFKQTISSLIFARKVGGAKYDLRLADITPDGNLFKAPGKVNLRFYNPGNVHVVPRGTVKLIGGEKVYAQGVINEESSLVLPERYRQINVALKRTSDLPWHFLSTYKLEVDYRYDGFDRFNRQTTTIRFISRPALIASILVIILTVAGYLAFKKYPKFSFKKPRIREQP